MKELPLSQGYVALVDDEDFDVFGSVKWTASVDYRRNGTIRDVYAYRNDHNSTEAPRVLLLHREILGVTGLSVDVDHRNNNGLDNQKHNLRLCQQIHNSRNSRKHIDNRSGYKGVSWHKYAGKWHVRIMVSGRTISVGYFADVKEAAKAYDKQAIARFGAFAHVNFP